jgi:hypothetical protein
LARRRAARPLRLATWASALALLLVLPARAQRDDGMRFRLEADQTRVAVGEAVTVTLTIENAGRNMDAAPTTPDFGDLRVQAGPFQQNSVQIINGAVSSNRSYQWQVAAPREGQYTIGPSRMTIDGRVRQTEPLTINAVANVSGALPASLRGTAVVSARARDSELTKALDGRLFLMPEISNRTPYVSQPVIVSYKLFRDPRLTVGSFKEQPPDVQGALVEELYHAQSVNWQRTQLDGQTYVVAPMLTLAIVPTKAGDFSVDGYAMTGSLVQPRQRQRPIGDPFQMMEDAFNNPFFNDPFGDRGVNVQLPTPPIELKVRPLPEIGKPAGFSGAVGAYTLSAAVDRAQAGEDDLITLTVVLKGRGAVELATPPVLIGDAFEVVGSSNKVEKTRQADGIGGSKRFEFVLRPRRAGHATLPAIDYAVFNPWAERYETLRTEPVALTIAPGTRPRVPLVAQAPGPSAGSTHDPGDLHYLKPIANLNTGHPTALLDHFLLWLAQLVALALCLTAWWRRRVLLRRDPAQQRRQGAWRRFDRRVRAVLQQTGAGEDPGRVAGRLETATRDCIADYFNLSADGLTHQEIERLLHERAMPAERVQRILDLLDRCAALRYAPAPAGQSDPRQWSEELIRLLKEGLAS